jgi:hypothetical protein
VKDDRPDQMSRPGRVGYYYRVHPPYIFESVQLTEATYMADGAVSLVGAPELAPLIDAGVHKGASMLQSKASDWVNKRLINQGKACMYLTV